MATAKKRAAERPYTLDEMAQIGNILSAAKMPADVAKALSTPRLQIDGLDEAPRVDWSEQAFQLFAASESFRHQPMYRQNGVQLEPITACSDPTIAPFTTGPLPATQLRLPGARGPQTSPASRCSTPMEPTTTPSRSNTTATLPAVTPEALLRFLERRPYTVGVTSGGERISGTPFGWWDEDNNIEAAGGGRSTSSAGA